MGNITTCSTNAMADLCCLICGEFRMWWLNSHCFSSCFGTLVVSLSRLQEIELRASWYPFKISIYNHWVTSGPRAQVIFSGSGHIFHYDVEELQYSGLSSCNICVQLSIVKMRGRSQNRKRKKDAIDFGCNKKFHMDRDFLLTF